MKATRQSHRTASTSARTARQRHNRKLTTLQSPKTQPYQSEPSLQIMVPPGPRLPEHTNVPRKSEQKGQAKSYLETINKRGGQKTAAKSPPFPWGCHLLPGSCRPPTPTARVCLPPSRGENETENGPRPHSTRPVRRSSSRAAFSRAVKLPSTTRGHS